MNMKLQMPLPGLTLPSDFHEFKQMLEYAEISTSKLRLEVFYKTKFPHVATIEKNKDPKLQRQGVDTTITMQNGKQYFFDEKTRAKGYGDILLEEYSVWRGYPRINRQTIDPNDTVPSWRENGLVPGWLSGNKLTDYISYIIIPSRKVYILPFLLLQAAWKKYYLSWLKLYGRKVTTTRDAQGRYLYHTTNIAIPTDTLFYALYETAEYPAEKETLL